MGDPSEASLRALAEEMRAAAWGLALEVVEEGLAEEAVPSLERLGDLGRLGDLPAFVGALARELTEPDSSGIRRGGALAAVVRDHARAREALGFAPREVVTELLLLRRVLWRFAGRAGADTPELARRLNETVDRLVVECVVAYFDRVTSELALRARTDPLTGLLNHQAFTDELDLELERARRYRHGLTLVFADLDRFKDVNDTSGHPEGDRVLRVVADALRDGLRRSDIAGRMGGDEFAVVLVESEPDAGDQFVSRLGERIDGLAAGGSLPPSFSLSAGLSHYPSEGADAFGLFRIADGRLYAAKRARTAA